VLDSTLYVYFLYYLEEDEECKNEFGVNSKVQLEKRVAFLEN